LKNIMGLWLLQECKRCWDVKGNNLDFAGLCALASGEAPLRSFIDPSDDAFFAPGDMPGRIQTYCRRTHQPVPETTGQIVRCILESLALKYRWALSNLEKVSGLRLAGLQIVGGGSRNSLLNQFTANATQRPVKAGPEDATALGNLVVQAIALGEIDDLASARNVIAASFPVSEYHPVDQEQWEEGFLRFEALMEQKEE
jgi:sugar (pentulose or hexulose) kinase